MVDGFALGCFLPDLVVGAAVLGTASGTALDTSVARLSKECEMLLCWIGMERCAKLGRIDAEFHPTVSLEYLLTLDARCNVSSLCARNDCCRIISTRYEHPLSFDASRLERRAQQLENSSMQCSR